jgi:1-phosphatidylinositol-3-phosphate 5-kinase
LSVINVVDYSILVGFDEDKHEIVAGIIDYMRQYDFLKRMERLGKSVGMMTGQAEPTIIQPVQCVSGRCRCPPDIGSSAALALT